MRQAITFKEWLPDQPQLSSDCLITAKNVLASPSGYRHFKTFAAGAATVPGGSASNAYAANSPTKGTNIVYISASDYYTSANGGAFTSRGGATVGAEGGMVQFDNLLIAVGTGHPAYKHTIGSASNMSTLASSGTAPGANVVGVIGRFVVIGDLLASTANSTQRASAIRWCGIDQPESWPDPNTATALAQQAGEQEMDLRFGQVTGIHGGDQHGVVLQAGSVTRMTYEGPPTVFRFDLIDETNGSIFNRGSIRVGGLTYFISRNGFCRTDGVQVERIGLGKVDKFFWDSVNVGFARESLNTGFDPLNNQVQWAFPTAASATCNRLMSFNPDTGHWTYCDVALNNLVTPNRAIQGQATMLAIATGFLGDFSGTAGSATIETSDAEFNPGGRAFIDGIKPNIESSATAPAMSMRVGYRDSLDAAPTYTSATSVNAATGFGDFRVDSKYARAEFTVVGNFDKFPGMVASVEASSER